MTTRRTYLFWLRRTVLAMLLGWRSIPTHFSALRRSARRVAEPFAFIVLALLAPFLLPLAPLVAWLARREFLQIERDANERLRRFHERGGV